MVNKEKYHGLSYHLNKLMSASIHDLNRNNIHLINQSDYLKKQAPLVYSEMKNNPLYKSWLDYDNPYIHIIKYNNKPVGYVGYDVGVSIRAMSMSHVYILEKYRGKGLFKQHLDELLNIRFSYFDKTNDMVVAINQPNRYLINSLLNAGLISQLNEQGFCFSPLFWFNIKMDETDDYDNRKSYMTPFYDMQLFSPVKILEDELIYDKLTSIDVLNFNAANIRNEFLDKPHNIVGLKYWINKVQSEVQELAFKEFGDELNTKILDRV